MRRSPGRRRPPQQLRVATGEAQHECLVVGFDQIVVIRDPGRDRRDADVAPFPPRDGLDGNIQAGIGHGFHRGGPYAHP